MWLITVFLKRAPKLTRAEFVDGRQVLAKNIAQRRHGGRMAELAAE